MNLRMRKLIASLGLLAAAAIPHSPSHAAEAPAPLLESATWRETFENGTIDGWFSYPPFQDTAYDFTIIPGSYRPKFALQGYVGSGDIYYPVDLAPPEQPAGNTYYLLRNYRPNSSSPQRIGMARPLTLVATAQTTLEFDYWIKPVTFGGVRLEINVAGADGQRYVAFIDAPKTNAWTRVKLSAGDLRAEDGGEALRAGVTLEAMAIIADYEQGDAGTVSLFAIDNVALSGGAPATLAYVEPKTESYRNWPGLQFAQRHYKPGDALDVRVEAPQVLQSLSARVLDFNGAELAPARPLQGSGTAWNAAALHTFTAQDPRGPLTLELSGLTPGGEALTSRVRLWLFEPPAAQAHPRLFFGPGDREALLARTREGRTQKAWESMVSTAKAARAKPVLTDGQVQDFFKDYLLKGIIPYFTALRNTGHGAMDNALVYAISGDEEAGAYAREALIKMSQWETWTHPWFTTQGRKTYYPVGLVAMQLGIAYDLVYPLLTPEERAIVRKGILEKGIANAFEEYFVDNRIPENTSNWISHNTAAPLVALMAIYGDDPQASDGGVEPYFAGLSEKLIDHLKLSLLPDGSYGEGFSYHNFTLESAVPWLAALSHSLKIDGLVEPLHLDNTYLFARYIQVGPELDLLDMGDSSPRLSYTKNWQWLTGATKDPMFKAYVDQKFYASWEDFLWIDDSLTTAPLETLPPSHIFETKGNAVFRTGWGEDDVAFNLRAGANFNHTHADQGNFRLWAYGEHLIREADHGDYYEDPYYWSFYIQSGGHNTLLIDDNPESQEFGDTYGPIAAFDRQARMTDAFASDKASWTSAEMGELYRGKLEQFERNAYFIDPGYVIFDDHVRSSGGEHLWQWQLFPHRAEGVTLEENTARYAAEKAALEINVLEPAPATLRLKPAPIPVYRMARFPETPMEPRGIIQIENPQANTAQTFTVLLAPTRTGETAPKARLIPAGDGRGVQVTLADGTLDTLLFAGSDAAIAAEGIEAEGSAAFVRKQAGKPTLLAGKLVNTFALDGKTLLEGDAAVNFSAELGTEGETWTLQAAQDVTLDFTPLTAGTLEVNGQPAKPGKLTLTAGRHTLQIRP